MLSSDEETLTMAEDRLAEVPSSWTLQQVIGSSPAGVILVDRSARIIFWNAGSAAIFGYSAEEALSSSIELISPERTKGSLSRVIKRVVAGEEPRLVGRTIELSALRKDGNEIPVEFAVSMSRDGDGVAFGAVAHDLTARRDYEQQLYRLARYDSLTGLPNRASFQEEVQRFVDDGDDSAVLIVDVDCFKELNDTLGHRAGNQALVELSRRMSLFAAPNGMVARLGGDAFGMLLRTGSDAADLAARATDLIDRLSRPMRIDGLEYSPSASIGIASFPLHASTVDEWLSAADLALKAAKLDGRRCTRVFERSMRLNAIRVRNLEADLHQAVKEEQFELYYQPQVECQTGRLLGVEALLRWNRPGHGVQNPATFITALEHSSLASTVGQWVMETACAQAARWQSRWPEVRVAINLFRAQLYASDLVPSVTRCIEENRLNPAAVELEITENIVLSADDGTIVSLRKLRDLGVQIAFDDYGTGYASLSRLKDYPVTRLKIDRSFVQNIGSSDGDAAIVRAIVYLGRSFGLSVTAEGVETEAQQLRLATKGCHELQGYLFGRPMPAAEFERAFLDGASAAVA